MEYLLVACLQALQTALLTSGKSNQIGDITRWRKWRRGPPKCEFFLGTRVCVCVCVCGVDDIVYTLQKNGVVIGQCCRIYQFILQMTSESDIMEICINLNLIDLFAPHPPLPPPPPQKISLSHLTVMSKAKDKPCSHHLYTMTSIGRE